MSSSTSNSDTVTLPEAQPEGNPAPSGSRTHGNGKCVLAVKIIVLGVLLSIAALLVMRLSGTRAELAETNYQANLIRLQDLLYGSKPKAILAGSSISGRLLPSYFKNSALAPVANLGLDGSGPPLGLQFCIEKPAPIVFVEVNTILKEWDRNDASLQEATEGTTFKMAGPLPVLRASFRPSSILYSWLKARRPPGEALRKVVSTGAGDPPATSGKFELSAGERKSAEKVEASIKRLQEAGCRVVMISVPAGKHSPRPSTTAYEYAADLSSRMGIPFVDLLAECEKQHKAVSYTDGLHLSPAAAKSVAQALADLAGELSARDSAGNRN